ncbi:MAG: hypothetical protein WD689_09485 [Gaiellaceae bacterium]
MTKERSLVGADVWTFKGEETLGDIDLTGWSVEATDGSIGKVDEATYDIGASWLIIDTGPWIFGHKVMLPAGIVDRIDPDTETVHVKRTKDEIKHAPEFEPQAPRADEGYLTRLGSDYGPPGV